MPLVFFGGMTFSVPFLIGVHVTNIDLHTVIQYLPRTRFLFAHLAATTTTTSATTVLARPSRLLPYH